jgi:hypothetical protein
MRNQQSKFIDYLVCGIAHSAMVLALIFSLGLSVLTQTVRAGGDKDSRKASEASETGSASVRRRDPFYVPARVEKKPVPVKVKPIVQQLVPAGVETRFEDYRREKERWKLTGGVEPQVLSAFLIDEINITGVFENSEGLGAFLVLEAHQKKPTVFAREGMKTHDGYIKEISPAGVRFVKHIRYSDGKVQQTEIFRAVGSGNAKK